MRLGLDLRGGTRLVMEADTSQAPDVDVDQALEAASRIIERRVNAFGVAESEIQRQAATAWLSSYRASTPMRPRSWWAARQCWSSGSRRWTPAGTFSLARAAQ